MRWVYPWEAEIARSLTGDAMTLPSWDKLLQYALLVLWVATEIHGISITNQVEQALAGLGILGTVILLLVDHARGQGVFK
jgi:hypothetical protein